MRKRGDSMGNLDDLNAQMLVIREFMNEFINKIVFRKQEDRSLGIPISQVKALFAFREENKAYSIGELGRNARLKRSTMTNMVDRLESDGIAERFRKDGDRRVVKVLLTGKGKKIRREFCRKRRKQLKAIFSKLNENEKRALIDHLKEAYQILRKI